MEFLPEVIDKIVIEMNRAVSDMAECKDLDERKKLAEIVKTLSDSLSIFLDAFGMMGPDFMDDYLDFDDEPTGSQDIVDFNSLKKEKRKGNRKSKKKSDDDIPF